MIHIKVQYDAYNRTFKLVDGDVAAFFEDYALYDLSIPFTFEDRDEGERGGAWQHAVRRQNEYGQPPPGGHDRFTSDTLQTFSFRIGSKCSRESSGFLAIVVLTGESSRNELVRKGRCECLQSPVSFQLCSGQVRVWFVLSHS